MDLKKSKTNQLTLVRQVLGSSCKEEQERKKREREKEMGTRSNIAILQNDGTVRSIYCHWDGYLRYMGTVLLENYNTPSAVEELINLGNLSRVAPLIGCAHEFENYSAPFDQYCKAYGRDRGESDSQAILFKNYREYVDYLVGHDYLEFAYIYRAHENQWYYRELGAGTSSRYKKLTKKRIKQASTG